jgi:RNA polymerase sigma-70 factor (ECF subfamily)
MNENELVKKAQEGDRDAMSMLYKNTFEYIYKYVYSSVNDKHRTEDIAAEVYLKAFDKIKKFKGKSSFKTWVYHIAKNEVYQWYREKDKAFNVEHEKLDYISKKVNSADVKEDLKMRENQAEKVSKILEALKPKYREVLKLRFLLNYSVKETAEVMNIKPNYAKVLTHRALKKARLVGTELRSVRKKQ